MTKQTCPNCEQSFDCRSEDVSSCWCVNYPAVLSADKARGCLCPDCLKAAVLPKIEQLMEEVKSGKRKNNLGQLTKSAKKLVEGIDFYREHGRWVMSEWFLLKRGYCCGNECRHCPYGHVNVRKGK